MGISSEVQYWKNKTASTIIMEEIQNVVDQATYDYIESQKRHNNSLGQFLRQREQAFLTNNQSESVVVMTDRKYQKLPNGWSLLEQENVVE